MSDHSSITGMRRKPLPNLSVGEQNDTEQGVPRSVSFEKRRKAALISDECIQKGRSGLMGRD